MLCRCPRQGHRPLSPHRCRKQRPIAHRPHRVGRAMFSQSPAISRRAADREASEAGQGWCTQPESQPPLTGQPGVGPGRWHSPSVSAQTGLAGAAPQRASDHSWGPAAMSPQSGWCALQCLPSAPHAQQGATRPGSPPQGLPQQGCGRPGHIPLPAWRR